MLKGKHQSWQPFSQASTKHLAGLVLNKHLDVVPYGTDRYGWTLGEVFVDGKNVNLEMVKAGLAEVYCETPSPGYDNRQCWNAEKAARDAGLGMWSLSDRYVSPREWGKGTKLIIFFRDCQQR